MPLPLVPVAIALAASGSAAFATYRFVRTVDPGRRDQRAEDALDDTPEGVTLRRAPDQTNATARIRRTFRFGPEGSAVEIDATAIGRITVKRVD
ncbi:hypothetical protein [Maritimibacter dapengensis]|uniref:Uncharacterized protein n=1 Tax=Maritimibacter dapengensis TaxID=2836868 RepID=A0ABS6T582_9RHOB|nr:hypothetical protein [Maritimibacter dapengensis]MBV7379706.1 hypothetical protein [Maritimibacter dapengensis]